MRCACSGWSAGPSSASSPGARPPPAAVRRDSASRAAACVEPAARRRCQHDRPVGARHRGGRAAPRPRRARRLRAVRRRDVAHRVRRAQLGLDGASAPVAAVRRLQPAMAAAGQLPAGREPASGCPARESASVTLRSRILAARRCWTASTSRFPPDRRSRSWARTAPARPRWPSCCAGSTTRRQARLRSTASTCATWTSTRGGRGWPRCSRTSSASKSRCATTSRRAARPRGRPRGARCRRRGRLARLDTICRARLRGRDGPLGRPVAARGAGTCALRRQARRGGGPARRADRPARRPRRGGDLRALLAATRHCTTILISHRFSTVRQADRICVLEHGKVVELGTHDELMALNGRYRTMFDLQAQRFAAKTRKGRAMTSSSDAARATLAAGALVDVAAVQARLLPRAGVDRRRLRAGAAGGHARCTAGGLVQAARRGCPGERLGPRAGRDAGAGLSATATWFLPPSASACSAGSATR